MPFILVAFLKRGNIVKKLIYLFVAVMILSILTGCQKDEGTTEEGVGVNTAVSENVVSEDASNAESINDTESASDAEEINISDTEKLSEDESTEKVTDNDSSEEEFAKELAEMQIVEEEGV